MSLAGSIDPIARVVIEALMNSLWQGVLLFSAVICILRIFRKLNSATRYIVMWLTLLTLAFLPFLNLLLITGESIVPVPAYSDRETVSNPHKAETLNSAGSTKSDPAGRFIARLPRLRSINIPVPLKVLPSLILGLWILMSIFMLLRLLRSHFYTTKLKRDMLFLSPEYQREITEFIKSTGIKRKVAIYVTSNVRMPMAVGLFDPVILIPDNLMSELTEEQLKHIILHELAHIRRRDDWTNLVQRIIEAFYFWNPMVLYIGRQMNLEREIACDDWVIILSGEPKSYALCLTKLVEFNMLASGRIIATGATLHGKHITTRIRMLLDKGCNTSAHLSRLGILTTICVIILAFAVFTRISHVVALAQPQRHNSRPSQQTEKVSVSGLARMQYPKLHLPEKIDQKAKDSKQDRVSAKIEEQRIVSEPSEISKDSKVSVSDPIAAPNAGPNLPEKTAQKEEIIDGLPETLDGNPGRTHIGAIDKAGEISQPDIAALIETPDNGSEEVRFKAADTPDDAGKPHKDDTPTIEKVYIKAAESLEGVKASSQRALESLDDKQEGLHHKAATALGKAGESMKEGKHTVQTFVDKLFSAIEK